MGGLIGDELRAESVDEIVVGCEPRLCGSGVNNACCNFGWGRCVWCWNGKIESRHLAGDCHGVCAKNNIRICSALPCDCVVARSQGDRDAGADDVVVGNREDAEVCDRRSRLASPCASLCGPATSHSRRGLESDPTDVIAHNITFYAPHIIGVSLKIT